MGHDAVAKIYHKELENLIQKAGLFKSKKPVNIPYGLSEYLLNRERFVSKDR